MTDRDQPNTAASPVKAGRPVVLQVMPRMVTGGAERGTVDIAVTLAEAGGTPLIASEGGQMEYELKRAGVPHIKLPLASKNPLVMHRNVGRLVSIIEKHDVDIVHARSRAPAWSAYLAAKKTGRHFVTTVHGAYKSVSPLKRFYNAVMVKGERVIATSEFIARHIRETYKVDPARVRVIRRGVDLDRLDPERVSAERVIQLARRWRLTDGVPLVMLPGRLARWKGHDTLIEALKALGDIELLCVIVGSDQDRATYRGELEKLIARSGQDGRVFLPGHCDDMPAAYMLADVVICASTKPEAFGRVVSEAQAMGCPVVASDHGGAREQALGSRTAFLYPPGDAAELAKSIRAALALDAGERERLAAEARAFVVANFDKRHMCAATLAIYQEILRAKEAAGSGAEQPTQPPGESASGP